MNSAVTETHPRKIGAAKAARAPRTWLRLLLVLLVVGLLAGGLIGFHQFKAGILKQVTAGIRAQQPTVATAVATSEAWQPMLSAVGSLRASRGADLSPEIGGVVQEINFESGQNVVAGAVLLRLRLNDDEAKLQQLQAAAELADVVYKRDVKQLAAQGVAQSTVDTDAGNLRVARAQVAAQQAIIDEKTVRAPFAGRLGVRQVDLGQYVGAGSAVVTLQALDPMFVDFYLPQQALEHVAPGQPVTVTVDAYPGRNFSGKITALNAKVDATSRMLQVRASVANPDSALLPGMFANVVTMSGAAQSLVTIPLAAVSYNPYGSLVYVVHSKTDAEGHTQAVVTQQFVTTGDQRGDQVSILKGIAAKDVVVTAGQLKLHNNALVKIDNRLNVTDDAAPSPQDQ